jgi:UDP-glucose 4-epimerase
MKVLVIGGAGFIGSYVVRYHLEQGNEVAIIDDYSTGVNRYKGVKNYHWYEDGLRWCDQVYMLAGSVGVQYVNNNPKEAILNNLALERKIFKLNEKYQKPLLFSSTSEVYGNSTDIPFKESADLHIGAPDQGRWGYACSKLMGEFLALHSNFPAVVVRFFNITGVGQLPDYGMVLPNFIQKALNNEPIEIYGDGTAVRCFCDVEEVVPLLCQLLDNKDCHNQVYNVGNPDNYINMENLANLVIEEVGSLSNINKIPFDEVFEKNPTDIVMRVPSIKKVIAATGWQPWNTNREIINKMVTSGAYTDFHK